jgi:hypothetical protein
MIACFLRQEYASHDRYGATLEACLTAESVSATRITVPDLADRVGNAERRRVFARYRGYGTGRASYLTDFPDTGVSWSWMALRPDELLDSIMIRYISAHELASRTRSPRETAERIRSGELTSEFAMRVRELADRLRKGHTVPPVILVSADGGVTRVILEGHTRLLAWALAPDTIAPETEVLLGSSPNIAKWDEY